MLWLVERIEQQPANDSLVLPFEVRQKSRFKATLENGAEVGVVLDRGKVLRGGDCLKAESGEVVVVKAAEETVSEFHCDDAQLFARACYHLGNRHVPLQVGNGFGRYLHDHVLDDMLVQLGVAVETKQASFEPEAGAYGGGHHHHHHD